MTAVLVIARSNIERFIRNRSFLVLAILAPLGITAALSSTIGPALSGTFRPRITIADGIGDGSLDGLVAGLRTSGFDDLNVVSSAEEARAMVEDGETDAAIVYSAALGQSITEPFSEPGPILIVADADADIATAVAEAIAGQSGRAFDSIRVLSVLGAPADDLSGPLTVAQQETGSRVLTDGTYFAVGISGYFAFIAATALVATIHRERRQLTLARMLMTPIGRAAPLVGKGLAAGVVAFFSYTTLVIATTLLLDANWGPPLGVIAIGLGLCVAAVGVSLAIAAVTNTEDSAGQIGSVVATAWAIFGGVFLPIPLTGVLNGLARLSPFKWVMDGIGLNAGVGSLTEVLAYAAVASLFGIAGFVVAFARRDHLGGS